MTEKQNGKITRSNVSSLEELDKKIQEIKTKDGNEPIYLWFVGALENGKSWCSDCSKAEPVIEKYLEEIKLKRDISIIICTVDKALFKSSENPYGKHKAQVKKVPTLLWWGKSEKLEEEDCMSPEMLSLLFTDVLIEE